MLSIVQQCPVLTCRLLHRFIAVGILLFAFVPLRAQLTQGEYTNTIIDTNTMYGQNSGSFEDCWDYDILIAHHLLTEVPGTQLYLFIDSIASSSDSIGVAHQNTVMMLYEGDSIPAVAFNHFYFYAATTVYYTLKRIGTPMTANTAYNCTFYSAMGQWADGCANVLRSYMAGTETCMVETGTYTTTNDFCSSATVLHPGLNWINNLDATGSTDLEIDCFDDNTTNTEEAGVWFSFTTPSYPVGIQFMSMPFQNSAGNSTGAQLAVFTSCGDPLIACANPDSSGTTSLNFGCDELAPNTTYHLLADGWQGQTGISQLYYTTIENCEITGCTDPAACNYDPSAGTDDGSCLYGNDCLTGITLEVDTIDCHNYVIRAVTPDGQPTPALGIWWNNGALVDVFVNEITIDENWDLTFTNQFCYAIQTDSANWVEACVELYVPENCDTLCPASISTTVTGCDAIFQLNLPFTTDADFQWDFGNGETLETGVNALTTYGDSGTYSVCVDLNFYGCIDTTLCTEVYIPGCAADTSVFGCTDPDALNYDPDATVDDGSCIYPPTCEFSLLAVPDTTDPDALEILVDFDYADLVSVFWDFGDGNTSTEFYPTHTYIDSQPYELCCTATFAVDSITCTATACTFLYDPSPGGAGFSFALRNESSTGLNENIGGAVLKLYPNPARDYIDWRLTEALFAVNSVEIFSVTGRLLRRDIYTHTSKGRIQLNDFSPGIYILQVSGNFGVQKSRFAIMR